MPLKGFDPGTGKWYENMREHITKQANKGLEDATKKLVEDMVKPSKKKVRRCGK